MILFTMDYFLYCKENATNLSYPKHLFPENGWPSTENIKACAIIGAGVMGQGIALAFLQAGFKTVLIEKDGQSLAYGLSQLWETVRKSLEKPVFDKNIIQLLSNNLSFGTNLNMIKDADFVVEAVYEDINLKLSLFDELDKICKSDAVLCSNTSTLDLDKIALATKRPGHVIGMHFFVPAHINVLVEIIHCSHTNKDSFNKVVQVAKQLGKAPVVVGNGPGFCGNRMCHALFSEALKFIAQGVEPQYIDNAMRSNLGMVMGPFQIQDLIGMDTINRISNESNWQLHPVLATLCNMGRLGRKTGKGWYVYKDGRRHIDENLKNILKEKGLIQEVDSAPSPEEIVKTLVYPMINEAFKIITDGIVIAPEAVDLIWLLGYGWPTEKGGPMYWASNLGLNIIMDFLNSKNTINWNPENYWKPSEMMTILIENGNVPLKDWPKYVPNKVAA